MERAGEDVAVASAEGLDPCWKLEPRCISKEGKTQVKQGRERCIQFPGQTCTRIFFFFFQLGYSFFTVGDPDGKESTCNVRDLGSVPGLGRSPGGGHGNPLQYSCLENPMDRGALRATVRGVAKSWTRLSN